MAKQYDRDTVIVSKAKQAIASQYGVTAVKVELEAVFGRRGMYEDNDRDNCEQCDNDETIECESCDGEGRSSCNDERCDNTDCIECENCEGDGTITCPRCNGSGYEPEEEQSDTEQFSRRNWGNETYCLDFLLHHLMQYGLARLATDDERNSGIVRNLTAGNGRYIPTGALKYARFYADQSVDSELTATLSIQNPDDVMLLPKLIEAWTALGDTIGNGTGTRNAGMHMAFINDPECKYPTNHKNYDNNWGLCYQNFRRSMTLLMPALFFLGANDSTTRGMHFRAPQVDSEKYSAIHLANDTLEYRVFDPCYDNPDHILDNFVVMVNSLRYWTTTYINPNMPVPSIMFGNDDGERLDRLYGTAQHIELLNTGLKRLKPAYLTIKAIKAQRGFTTNRRELGNIVRKLTTQARNEYAEYADRFEWFRNARKQQRLARMQEERYHPGSVNGTMPSTDTEWQTQAELQAEQYAAEIDREKQSIENYIADRVQRQTNKRHGSWQLGA